MPKTASAQTMPKYQDSAGAIVYALQIENITTKIVDDGTAVVNP